MGELKRRQDERPGAEPFVNPSSPPITLTNCSLTLACMPPLLESHPLNKMNQDRQHMQSRLFCRCSSPGCRGRRYHDRSAFNHAHDHTCKRTLIPCHLLIWLSHSCLDEPEDEFRPYFRKNLAPRMVTIYGKPKCSFIFSPKTYYYSVKICPPHFCCFS